MLRHWSTGDLTRPLSSATRCFDGRRVLGMSVRGGCFDGRFTMPINNASVLRWAGLSAVVAGVCYVLVGLFHPLNVPASVTTPQWLIVHVLAMAMSIFGLLGMTGLYARQLEKTGWLGLLGYLLLSLWLALILGFTFVEVFVLPVVAASAPAFVESWMAMFGGPAGTLDVGPLPLVWTITGPIYILGGLLFGIATFRAAILPRWAGVLLAIGTVIGPVAILFPPGLQPKVAVPVGLALVWLGYALWSERRG